MKKYIIAIIGLLIIGAIVIIIPASPSFQRGSSKTTAVGSNKATTVSGDNLLPNDMNSINVDKTSVPIDTIPSSTTVLVNKKYLLPSTYIPSDLVYPNIGFSFYRMDEKKQMRKEAADALEKMFDTAKQEGVVLYGVSGYRSYKRQCQIYNRNVLSRGTKQTDSVSARPGSSEHQTGLSIDISAKSVGCLLEQSLGKTTEGKWIEKNCYKFGYIIRYPKGKENLTGYSYEPWHIRYVGKAVAKYLHDNKLCLEEYFGLDEKYLDNSNTVTGVDVEDPNTVKYSTPTPTPTKRPATKKTATPKPTLKATPKKSTPKAAPKKSTPKSSITPPSKNPTQTPSPTPSNNSQTKNLEGTINQ